MPIRNRLAGKTKHGATFIVHFGWQISIIKLNTAPLECAPYSVKQLPAILSVKVFMFN
jgi:hypothetical protein